MLPVIKHFLTFVACFLAVWLLGSFILMDMNANNWTEEGRYFVVVLSLTATIALGMRR